MTPFAAHPERSAVLQALQLIDESVAGQGFDIKVEPSQPVYADIDHAAALREALQVARLKAEAIADLENCHLGALVRFEELTPTRRGSGVMGDRDWWGDSDRGHIGSAGAEVSGVALDDPTRTIWVYARASFDIAENETKHA